MSTTPNGAEQPQPSIDKRLVSALARVIDPEIRRPIIELDMIAAANIDEAGIAHASIELTIAGCPAAVHIESDVRQALESVVGAGNARVNVGTMSEKKRAELIQRLRGERASRNAFGPDSLTTIVAVASGKGGVGKSSISANIAVALAASGKKVGILDADVYGFSVPRLLGLTDAAPTRVDDLMMPPVAYGVKAISIGMFVGSSQALAWRGPILHRTLTQFVSDVFFGDVDVLVIDLPPGTGDVALSVGQLMPNAGVVVVTTPQVAAAEVAIRSGALALKLEQRVLGVVENMSWLDRGGERIELFGSGGGEAVAQSLSEAAGYDVPLLGQVPFDEQLRIGGDEGEPLVLSAPDSPAGMALRRIAEAAYHRPGRLAGRNLPLSVTKPDRA